MRDSLTEFPAIHSKSRTCFLSAARSWAHVRMHVLQCVPAAYWRRWTSVKTVRFEAAVRGNAKISVFRSTGRGLIYPVAMKTTTASESETRVCIDVPMTGLMDGGYFWFDAESLDGSVTITDATWSVPVRRVPLSMRQPCLSPSRPLIAPHIAWINCVLSPVLRHCANVWIQCIARIKAAT